MNHRAIAIYVRSGAGSSFHEGGRGTKSLTLPGRNGACQECLSGRQRPHLRVLNWVTLNRVRIRISRVHICNCEASLANESSLRTGTSVADGLDYLS